MHKDKYQTTVLIFNDHFILVPNKKLHPQLPSQAVKGKTHKSCYNIESIGKTKFSILVTASG